MPLFQARLTWGLQLRNTFYFFIFFVGQLHEDVPTEEHPGNLTIFCRNTLTAKAYQLIHTTLYLFIVYTFILTFTLALVFRPFTDLSRSSVEKYFMILGLLIFNT